MIHRHHRTSSQVQRSKDYHQNKMFYFTSDSHDEFQLFHSGSFHNFKDSSSPTEREGMTRPLRREKECQAVRGSATSACDLETRIQSQRATTPVTPTACSSCWRGSPWTPTPLSVAASAVVDAAHRGCSRDHERDGFVQCVAPACKRSATSSEESSARSRAGSAGCSSGETTRTSTPGLQHSTRKQTEQSVNSRVRSFFLQVRYAEAL